MQRLGATLGAVLLVGGVFWAGRESTHGLAAFWDHWWCPIPVVLVVVGVVVVATARRRSPSV